MSDIRPLVCDENCIAHGGMKFPMKDDELLCDEGCPLTYKEVDMIMYRLPSFLCKYIMSFAVTKYNWWSFNGTWKVAEILIGQSPGHHVIPFKVSPADEDYGITIGEIIGHYIGPMHPRLVNKVADGEECSDEYMIVFWKGIRLFPQECFIPVKEAWFFDPDGMWWYFTRNVLCGIGFNFTRRNLLEWYKTKFMFGGSGHSYPGYYKIWLPYCKLLLGYGYEDRVSCFTKRMSDGYNGEYISFGKSHLSVRKLLFQYIFTGESFWGNASNSFDIQIMNAYDLLEKECVYGLPIEYFVRCREITQ